MGLLYLALLVATPALPLQQSTTWRADVHDVDNRSVFTVGLDTLNDGGCLWVEGLSTMLSQARPTSWRVARLDRDGATTWERFLDVPVLDPGSFENGAYLAAASSSGVSVIALQRVAETMILRHDPAGTRRSDIVVAAPNPSLDVAPSLVWTNDQGEVVLAALERNLSALRTDWRMTLRGFDAAGQEVWRHEVPALSGDAVRLPSGEWLMAGRTPSASTSPNSQVELLRVAATGSLIASSVIDVVEPMGIEELRADPLTGGSMLIGFVAGLGDQVVALDGNDMVVWIQTVEPIQVGTAVADPLSGRTFFAVHPTSSTPNELIALDAAGSLVVEAAHTGQDTYVDIAPRSGGGVLALSYVGGAVPMLEVREVDGAGNVQGGTLLGAPPLSATGLSPRSMALESDGLRSYVTVANQGFTGTDSFLHQLIEGNDGTNYCPQTANSTGSPGVLTGAGSDLLTDERFTLVASNLPPMQFGVFATSKAQGSVPGAGGSAGTLCLGGAVGRFVAPGQVRQASDLGRLTLELDFGALPQPNGFVPAAVGETWYFQLWHRDPLAGFTSHFTGALATTLR